MRFLHSGFAGWLSSLKRSHEYVAGESRTVGEPCLRVFRYPLPKKVRIDLMFGANFDADKPGSRQATTGRFSDAGS